MKKAILEALEEIEKARLNSMAFGQTVVDSQPEKERAEAQENLQSVDDHTRIIVATVRERLELCKNDSQIFGLIGGLRLIGQQLTKVMLLKARLNQNLEVN